MNEHQYGVAGILEGDAIKRYRGDLGRQAEIKRNFKYLSPDEQLLEFVMDGEAISSDGFILYALAWCGVASLETIIGFLGFLRREDPSLMISSEKDRETRAKNLKARLRVLFDRGLIYSVSVSPGDSGGEFLQLYGISDSGFDIMRQHMRLVDFSNNRQFAYKAPSEILEWGAASFVGCMLMERSRKVRKELGRSFFSKKSGSFFLPFEFKSQDESGRIFYVGGMNGNWEKNEGVQGGAAYADWLSAQVGNVKTYLKNRTTKGTAVVCLVVESVESLRRTTAALAADPEMASLLDRVAFTGEAAIRKCGDDVSGAFLRMGLDGGSIVVGRLSGGASFV